MTKQRLKDVMCLLGGSTRFEYKLQFQCQHSKQYNYCLAYNQYLNFIYILIYSNIKRQQQQDNRNIMDNSIEVFNCPLCSFCETGLDRLVKHIRHHIKPEPTQQTSATTVDDSNTPPIIDSPIMPRDFSEEVVNQQKERLDSYINNLSSSKDPSPASKLFSNTNSNNTSKKEELSVDIDEPSKVSPPSSMSRATKTAQEKNTAAYNNSDINNKEKAKQSPTDPSVPSSLSVQNQPHIQLTALPGNLSPHPHHVVSGGGKSDLMHPMHASSPQVNHSSPHGSPMMYVRNEAAKYVKIHPSPYGAHHPSHPPPPPQSAPQYKQYRHNEQFVPISPVVNSNSFHGDKKAVPMEVYHHRQPPAQPPPPSKYISPQQQHSSRGKNGGRGGHLEKGSYQLPSNYHPVTPAVQSHQHYPARPNHQSTFKQQQQPHHQQQHQQSQQHQQQIYHHQNVQPRVDDIRHNLNLSNVGFPNQGHVYTNPEQIQRVIGGSSASIDQLAGLLVIPLKKTSEIAVQTDPVTFEDNRNGKRNNNPKNVRSSSCSVQTDLLMHNISEQSHYQQEQRSTSPVMMMDQIRSTDSLHECLICGDEFVGNQQLQQHMRTSHQYVCDNCFHASTSLQEHSAHTTECGKCDAELLCMDCNSSFSSVKKLNQHRVKNHGLRMPFRCGICNQPFESHDAVMDHMSSHDNHMPEFKCRYCTKVFQSAEALEKHCHRHKQVTVEHQCRFCQKSFNTDSLLRDHIGIAHVIREDEEDNMDDMEMEDPEPLTIKKRSQISTSVDDQKIEVVRRPPVTSFSGIPNTQNSNRKYFLCRYCDLAYKNKELLSKHVKMCSKNGSSAVTSFICDVCKEFFESDEARKRHLKNDHRRQNGYRCPKCSKVYRTWTRLKFHTKQQHLKKNCPDCTSVFTKEHILRKHQEDVHGKSTSQNGDRIYKCSDCSLTMYTLTDLTMHRRTVHPNSLSKSSKSSASVELSSNATMLSFIDNQSNNISNTIEEASNVAEDESTKTGEHGFEGGVSSTKNNTQIFACERCNSTFDSSKRLKNHLGLTHGERPFVCDICNKRFQYSSQIVWHMKNHKNRSSGGGNIAKMPGKLWKSKTSPGAKFLASKPFGGNYVCQFCGAQFKQEKLLKNHKGVVHKIKLFSCFICAAKYGHSTELIWHERTCKAKFIRENPGKELPEKHAVDSSASQQTDGTDEVTTDNNDDEFHQNGKHEDGDEKAEHNGEESFVNNNHTEEGDNEDVEEDADEEMDLHDTNIQLSKEEAEELLQNDPEYDHSKGEYTCPLCRKTTKSITGMKTHYGRVHGIWGKETSHKYANGQKITVWPCRSCDEEFQSFESIQSHCLEEHGMSVNKEDLDFETRQEMVSNQHTAASAAAAAVAAGKPTTLFTCQSCGACFNNSKSIRVHTFKKHGNIMNDAALNESRNNDADDKNSSVTTSTTKKVSASNNNSKNTDPAEDGLRYSCPRCSSQYRSTKSLCVHSYRSHNVILTKTEIAGSKVWVSFDDTPTPPSNTTSGNSPNKGRDLVEAPNPCDRCGRVFGNYRALFTHYRQAHRITDPNHVFVPRKPSRTELSILTHDGQKDGNDSLHSPRSIGSSASNNSNIKQYPETASSVDCPKCGRTFTNHKSFVAHLYSAHKVSKDQYSSYWPNGIPILPRESSTCPSCNKECLDERAMRIHMFKAHGTHYRDYCNDQGSNKSDSLASPDGMVTMVNETSFAGMNVSNEDIGLTCYVCSKLCKSRKSLVAHEFAAHGIRREKGNRLFPEDLLKREQQQGFPDDFSSMSMVAGSSDHHDNNNSNGGGGEKPFTCSICEASYHNRRAITTHLCRVHKYKKDDVKGYFDQYYADDVTMTSYVDDVNPLVGDDELVDDESAKMVIDEDGESIVHVLRDDYVGEIDDDGDDNIDKVNGVYNGNDDKDIVPTNALIVDATA